MKALDPVTLAVLNGRLVQIADEMDATLFRSAFNPIIAEAHDACHGLYHAETGATLVQGTSGLPIFVGAMAFAVKAVIDKAARDGDLDPRDTYLFNDPYDGGTHLNDVRLVRPLMREGKVFAWLASVGHWLDVGGNVPGNFNAKATESFQEGFRIPPVKLIRAGREAPPTEHVVAAFEAGGIDYVTKPIRPREVLARPERLAESVSPLLRELFEPLQVLQVGRAASPFFVISCSRCSRFGWAATRCSV